MRLPCALLLAVLVTALALPVTVGAGALPPQPSASYHWAQPDCAPVTAPYAQPPAWIPTAAITVAAVPGSDYVWPQPGGPVVNVSCAQPVPAS